MSIVSTAGICGGLPRVDGTRITVEHVCGLVAKDVALGEITADYGITLQNIAECILYEAPPSLEFGSAEELEAAGQVLITGEACATACDRLIASQDAAKKEASDAP